MGKSTKITIRVFVSVVLGWFFVTILAFGSYWFKEGQPLRYWRANNWIAKFLQNAGSLFGWTYFGFVCTLILYSALIFSLLTYLSAWRGKKSSRHTIKC